MDRTLKTAMLLLAVAALPLAMSPRAAMAEIGTPAGVAGAVTGEVGLVSPAKQIVAPVSVASGDGIVMGDGISTGKESRLQIMLLDESAFTLGPEAELTIDEFVFDPTNTNKNALNASIAKGAFRLVTGAIARGNPEGTTLQLPNAVLTIRGTTVIGACAATCVIALSGSGEENSAGKKPSEITLKTPKGEAKLTRAGYFVEIGSDGSITPPEQLTDSVERNFSGLFPSIGDVSAIERKGPAGVDGRAIVGLSGQPAQEGLPLSLNQRDFELADHLDGNDTFEATSNLPVRQVRYYTDTAPIFFAGPSGGGNYGIDYTLNLAERSFTGNLQLNCTTCTAGAFTTSIPLLINPFEQGFHLVESGFVLDPTAPNDTFKINYVIGPNNIGAIVQYDVDGSGANLPSTGSGVAPTYP